jgi:5-methylcytosine-specific restriction protein A
MPSSPLKPCSHPGCGALTDGRWCDSHAAAAKAEQARRDARRGSAASRGYGWKWQQASKGFLRANPLCRLCQQQDRVEAATVTDHIVPHRGDMRLFWDRQNWQPLCKRHHDAKTAREDGGFGRGAAGHPGTGG